MSIVNFALVVTGVSTHRSATMHNDRDDRG